MEETILTADQVAKILQVHPFTVLKFIKQGKLKASKLGRVYRIRKSDVDEFLESLVEKPTQREQVKKASPKKKVSKKEVKVVKELKKETRVEERNRENSDLDHYVIEIKK